MTSIETAQQAVAAATQRRQAAEDAFKAARDEVTAAQQALAQARKALAGAQEAERRRVIERSRRQAKALAARLGVEIERHTDLSADAYFVSHPDLLDTPADPYEGDHYVHSWPEILDRVQGYAKALGAK